MNPSDIKSHAELVREQVERAKNEGTIGSQITAEHIQRWFARKHGCDWRAIVKQQEEASCRLSK